MAWTAKRSILGGLALCLAAWTGAPAQSGPAEALGLAPSARTDEITVVTYNVRGMPWPAAYNRGDALRVIGEQLGKMRQLGRQPDVVLIQEGFIGDVADLVKASGYRYWIKGPDKSVPGLARASVKYPLSGEGWGHFESSGLHILSDFPARKVAEIAYGVCAGFDCLANKGAMLAHLDVPGLPGGVDIVNTHLNSRRASKVPLARSLDVHHRQLDELNGFIKANRSPGMPLLVGGDFNVKKAPERYDYGRGARPFTVVSELCSARAESCAGYARVKTPWLKSQDLQGFANAGPMALKPVEIAALFAAGDTGGKLSDHYGYMVRYRFTNGAAGAPKLDLAAADTARASLRGHERVRTY